MPPVSKCMIGRQATRSKGDLELVKHEHADEPVPEKQGSLFRIAHARRRREKKKNKEKITEQQKERSNTQKQNSKLKKKKCGRSKKSEGDSFQTSRCS